MTTSLHLPASLPQAQPVAKFVASFSVRSRAEYNKVDLVPHGVEENAERVDVEVTVATLASDRSLACVSAWETAERYRAALVNGLDR